MNEDGGKEFFSLLQQFLTSNGVDFSRGIKSIFEEHLSINLHGFKIHLMPVLHLNLLLQKKRILLSCLATIR